VTERKLTGKKRFYVITEKIQKERHLKHLAIY